MNNECKHKLTKFLGWQENYDKTGFYKLVNCLTCLSTISDGFYTNEQKEKTEETMKFIKEKQERKAVMSWLIDRHGINSTVSHENGWLKVKIIKPTLKMEAMEKLMQEILMFTERKKHEVELS